MKNILSKNIFNKMTSSKNNDVNKIIETLNKWYNCPEITFDKYIQLNLSNPMNAIKVLDTCKCCHRHQINRPDKLKKYESPPDKLHSIKGFGSCQCECRHMSRHICRAFID